MVNRNYSMANESKTTYVREIDMEIPILPMTSGRISLSLSLLLSNPVLTVSSTSPHHALYIAANCTEGITILQCKVAGQYVSTIWQLALLKQWSFSYKRWVGETFANLHKESQHFDLYHGFQIHWFYCEFFKMQIS